MVRGAPGCRRRASGDGKLRIEKLFFKKLTEEAQSARTAVKALPGFACANRAPDACVRFQKWNTWPAAVGLIAGLLLESLPDTLKDECSEVFRNFLSFASDVGKAGKPHDDRAFALIVSAACVDRVVPAVTRV